MKQTAVEWLIEKLDNNLDIKHSWRTKQYIDQAKEMEKQQIENAFKEGFVTQQWDKTKENKAEIITHTHKTPLEQADEILLLVSVSGRSELLLSFAKFIDADCDLLGIGYIEEIIKKFEAINSH